LQGRLLLTSWLLPVVAAVALLSRGKDLLVLVVEQVDIENLHLKTLLSVLHLQSP
jgi:hypothetical protein